MKLNKKLLVTSVLLLGLSTVAMSTATYAWFTVNKTAAFSATASVKADNDVEIGTAANGGHAQLNYGTTAIDLDVLNGATATEYATEMAKTDATSRKTTTHTLQDISGDGAKFYKPVFAADNTSFNSISEVTSYSTYYMVATFTFRSDKAYHIMIGDNSGGMITDTNTKTALNNAARLAFFDSGKSATTTLTRSMLRQVVYEGASSEYYLNGKTATSSATTKTVPDTSEGAEEGATKTATADGYASFADMQIEDDNYCEYADDESYESGDYGISCIYADQTTVKPTSIAAGHENGRRTLTVLEKNGTYTSADGSTIDAYTGSVTMVFWIEGADAQCITANQLGKLSVSVDFAALIA